MPASIQGVKLPKENRLYVVLHGLITLVDIGPEGYLAILLEIGDIHAYKYGTWLYEKDIPPRGKGQFPLLATLQGVGCSTIDPGRNDIDPGRNVVVDIGQVPTATKKGIRAVFRLPRPRIIYHFVETAIPPGALTGPDTSHIRGTPSLATSTKVFEYLLYPGSDVALVSDALEDDVLWEMPDLSRTTDPDIAVATLQIYNEPPVHLGDDEGKAHGLYEFKESMNFLNLQIALTKTTDPHDPPSTRRPQGLLRAEIAPLDTREETVRNLASAARQNIAYDDRVGSGSGGQICSGAHAVVTTMSSAGAK